MKINNLFKMRFDNQTGKSQTKCFFSTQMLHLFRKMTQWITSKCHIWKHFHVF